MFTLAHLSDLHIGPLPRPRLREMLSKRCFAYMSWQFRRKAIHDGPVLSALISDLKRQTVDHIAITGDITNLSLPREFLRAGEWLHALDEPHDLTVVPGNHDAYIHVPWDLSWRHWNEFMSGASGADIIAERPVASPEDFPFVRIRGGIALIGVSTACPTPPLSAAGRIGGRQLASLADRLSDLGRRKLFRVVLMHHPPLPGDAKRRKQLHDGPAFCDVIARVGAELVLFGHTHRSAWTRLAVPGGFAPAIGVPSASARPTPGYEQASYHLYKINPTTDGWQLEVEVRRVDTTLDRFSSERQFALAVVA